MGIHTEKGKITTGVLAAVLLTTAIMVPVSIFTDRALHEQKLSSIQTYGYDGSITSTGARQNDWMGIDGATASDQNNTLLANASYHGVDTPEKMIDGVTSSDGVAYLSNATVSQHADLKALDISTDGETWTTPTDAGYISAPLNMNMKVPASVATVLRGHLASAGTEGTALAISDLGEYGTWLTENNYQTDFAYAVIVFNYIAYGTSAKEALATAGFSSVNENATSDEAFKAWIGSTFTDFESWGLARGQNHELLIDGTGTDEVAVEILIKALNENILSEADVKVMPNLNDGGSYRAWETTAEASLAPGVDFNPDEYDSSNDGTANAFIGTQSRGFDEKHFNAEDTDTARGDELSYWGYNGQAYLDLIDSGKYDANMDNVKYDLADFTTGATADELPLSVTMAADSIVFFTTSDLTVNGKEVKGVTQEGYKMIFQGGATWDQLALMNELEF